MSSIGGFVLVGVVSDGRGVVVLTHTPQLSFSDMIEVPVPAKASEEAATIGDGGIEVMVVVGAMVGGTCSGVKTNDESVVGPLCVTTEHRELSRVLSRNLYSDDSRISQQVRRSKMFVVLSIGSRRAFSRSSAELKGRMKRIELLRYSKYLDGPTEKTRMNSLYVRTYKFFLMEAHWEKIAREPTLFGERNIATNVWASPSQNEVRGQQQQQKSKFRRIQHHHHHRKRVWLWSERSV